MRNFRTYFVLLFIFIFFCILSANLNINETDSLLTSQSKSSEKVDPIVHIISNSNKILNNINTNITKTIPESIFGLSTDLITTFLLSLMVSFITFYLAYYVTTIRKRKNLIQLYKYLIDFLIKAAKEQSQNFIKLTELLNEKKTYSVYPLNMKCDFNLNSLNKLPLDIVIGKIIKRKSQPKIFSTFLTKLNILDSLSNRYQIDLEKMVEKFDLYTKKWNYNINKIREGFDSYVAFFKNSGGYRRGVDLFFDEFNIIYTTFQKQENYLDYYVTIEYLLNPLHQLCKDHIENRTALTLMNHILACKASFRDYERTKKLYSDIFANYAKLAKDSSEFIEDKVNDIFKN